MIRNLTFVLQLVLSTTISRLLCSVLVDFHMSIDTTVQNVLLVVVYDFYPCSTDTKLA